MHVDNPASGNNRRAPGNILFQASTLALGKLVSLGEPLGLAHEGDDTH